MYKSDHLQEIDICMDAVSTHREGNPQEEEADQPQPREHHQQRLLASLTI